MTILQKVTFILYSHLYILVLWPYSHPSRYRSTYSSWIHSTMNISVDSFTNPSIHPSMDLFKEGRMD